jgi:hypothetical protein
MKLIPILKTLLTETIFIDEISIGGQHIQIFNTFESMRAATGSGSFIRVELGEILDSMSDIYDVIYKYSIKILEVCHKKCSIVIRDYRLGFDYQLFISYNRKNALKITINTSIRHPKKLKNETFKSPEIILQRDGEMVLKEDIDLINFTKIVKGDIIIYIKNL